VLGVNPGQNRPWKIARQDTSEFKNKGEASTKNEKIHRRKKKNYAKNREIGGVVTNEGWNTLGSRFRNEKRDYKEGGLQATADRTPVS